MIRFLLVVVLIITVDACAPERPHPEPKYKVGQVVKFVMGGQPAHVLFHWCHRDYGCLYDVRAFSYADAPRKLEAVREWELNPGK